MKVKRYADILGKGLISEMAPDMAAGVLVELFRRWNVDVAKITRDVTGNRPLWKDLDPKHLDSMKKLSQRAGRLDWATADWAINAIRRDFPAVASLILGWPEAREWLERQVAELKQLLS